MRHAQAIAIISPGERTESRALHHIGEEFLVEAAQIFHQHFYNHLARHGRVDQALAAARFHLYQEEKLPGQWAIPVLYLGSGDGQLFQPEGDVLERLPELETAKAKGYDELAGDGDPTLSKATQQFRSQANQLGLAPANCFSESASITSSQR